MDTKSKSLPEMSKEMAALVLSQLTYWPSRVGGQYEVTSDFSYANHTAVEEALATIGFDLQAPANSNPGVDLVFPTKSPNMDKLSFSDLARQNHIDGKGETISKTPPKEAAVFITMDGIKKLLVAGVQNPVLDLIAKEEKIIIPSRPTRGPHR